MKINKTKLLELRVDAGLSPRALSKKSGVALLTYYRILGQKPGRVRTETIIKLSKALRCKPSELLEEE